jgi:hypothetical protein
MVICVSEKPAASIFRVDQGYALKIKAAGSSETNIEL